MCGSRRPRDSPIVLATRRQRSISPSLWSSLRRSSLPRSVSGGPRCGGRNLRSSRGTTGDDERFPEQRQRERLITQRRDELTNEVQGEVAPLEWREWTATLHMVGHCRGATTS